MSGYAAAPNLEGTWAPRDADRRQYYTLVLDSASPPKYTIVAGDSAGVLERDRSGSGWTAALGSDRFQVKVQSRCRLELQHIPTYAVHVWRRTEPPRPRAARERDEPPAAAAAAPAAAATDDVCPVHGTDCREWHFLAGMQRTLHVNRAFDGDSDGGGGADGSAVVVLPDRVREPCPSFALLGRCEQRGCVYQHPPAGRRGPARATQAAGPAPRVSATPLAAHPRFYGPGRRLGHRHEDPAAHDDLGTYEERLDALEDVVVPASAAVVEALPTAPYALVDDSKALVCAVCQEEVTEGERIKTLPCLDRFHVDCIDQALTYTKKCPLCRHEVE